MLPKNSVKPLELVVSAIHCLKEKNGSSPQKIVRYLEGKYNVDTEVLRPHVQIGLKRGLSFGLITQKSGLYRLNDVLSSPKDSSNSDISSVSSKRKFGKFTKGLKKQQLRRMVTRNRRRYSKQETSAQKHSKRSKKNLRRRRYSGGSRRSTKTDQIGRRQKRNRRRSSGSGGRRESKLDNRRKTRFYAPVKSEISAEDSQTGSNKEPDPQKP